MSGCQGVAMMLDCSEWLPGCYYDAKVLGGCQGVVCGCYDARVL